MNELYQGMTDSPRAIQHYDIGNEFYRLWLDPSLTYSCPFWSGPDDSLHAAQLRKLDHHVASACATGAARVLDIGCGWGALLERLVGVHGVQHAVGLTLSKRQAEWIQARELPRSTVLLSHWQDHRPAEDYDAIISIEAFEHFAHIDHSREQRIRSYRDFFVHCRDLLRPRGMLSMQTTLYETLTRLDPFITSRIWPESQLPRIAEVMEALDHVFEVVRIENHREDYERTLTEWASRLTSRRDEAARVTSEQVTDDYVRYLKMSARAFRTSGFSVQSMLLRALPPG